MAVACGRAHVDLTDIRAIGIDEIHWQHGPHFLTLVYQIDATRKRLLWIGQSRRAKTLLGFFRWFGKERTAALAFVCSDMWKPYLNVVAKKAGHALHILDRFHIAKHMSDAIDQVRRAEVHALRPQGRQPLLTKTRWLLLKRPDNQTREQRTRLRELVQHNLRAVRAMLLRESFDPFWTYRSVDWAGAFLDEWCVQVMRSRIEPMKNVARMLRRHRPLHGEIKTPPFGPNARLEAGFFLRRLQRGESIGRPHSRPMPTVGAGCHELRIVDANLSWRIMHYIATDAVVILDVFNKQTAATPKPVIAACQRRLAEYKRLTAMKKEQRNAKR